MVILAVASVVTFMNSAIMGSNLGARLVPEQITVLDRRYSPLMRSRFIAKLALQLEDRFIEDSEIPAIQNLLDAIGSSPGTTGVSINEVLEGCALARFAVGMHAYAASPTSEESAARATRLASATEDALMLVLSYERAVRLFDRAPNVFNDVIFDQWYKQSFSQAVSIQDGKARIPLGRILSGDHPSSFDSMFTLATVERYSEVFEKLLDGARQEFWKGTVVKP